MDFSKTDCIQQTTVLECTWTNCPEEVQADVRKIWDRNEYGNDFYYHPWDPENEYWAEGMDKDTTYAEAFPKLAAYLKERGVKQCLIHWWW